LTLVFEPQAEAGALWTTDTTHWNQNH